MTEEEIIGKTKAILNEIGDEDDSVSLLSEDTVEIEDYIKQSIPEAVSLVQLNSPVRSVNRKTGEAVSSTLTPDDNGCCVLSAPDDFVDLRIIKLSEWKRACAVAYPMSSEEYLRQGNEYTRAGAYHPVVVLGNDADGNRVLLLYTATADTTVEIFTYEASYTSGEGITASETDPIALAVCYMTASLVYDIFENSSTADRLRQIALSLIPLRELPRPT